MEASAQESDSEASFEDYNQAEAAAHAAAFAAHLAQHRISEFSAALQAVGVVSIKTAAAYVRVDGKVSRSVSIDSY